MKRLVALAIIILIGTTASIAQNRGGQRNTDPVEMAKRQTAEIKEAVGLDEEQETQVYDINLTAAKNMATAREDSGEDRNAMREKMREIRDESNKEMKKVLTEEQWTKYEKYQEKRREQRGQRRGGGQQ